MSIRCAYVRPGKCFSRGRETYQATRNEALIDVNESPEKGRGPSGRTVCGGHVRRVGRVRFPWTSIIGLTYPALGPSRCIAKSFALPAVFVVPGGEIRSGSGFYGDRGPSGGRSHVDRRYKRPRASENTRLGATGGSENTALLGASEGFSRTRRVVRGGAR
jgi:hypothetical protein